MGWIKRKADEHVCKKPYNIPGVNVGDIWQCDECGLKWEVTKSSTWFDQRDNYTGYTIDYRLVPPYHNDWNGQRD